MERYHGCFVLQGSHHCNTFNAMYSSYRQCTLVVCRQCPEALWLPLECQQCSFEHVIGESQQKVMSLVGITQT